MPADFICRTAVYVTRLYGGVGGGSREASPYPKWARIEDELTDQRQMIARNFLRFHPAFKYDIES